MLHYLNLIFLLGVHLCLAAPLLPDPVDTADNYLALAKHYEEEGISDKAIAYYELAKTDFSQQKEYALLVNVLNRLASLYMTEPATYERAETYLDSAKVLLNEKLYKNDTLRILTWESMANLKSEQRKYDEAIAFYQNSLDRKKSVYGENHLEVAEGLEQIGSTYLYALQNPYASKQYFEQALKIREFQGDQSRLLNNCYYYLAVANRLQGEYEKALAYGFLALRGYESLPVPYYKNIMVANNLLGNIYFDMDSLDAALGYSKNAIQLATSDKMSGTVDISLYYNNQAMYHYHYGAYDSTIHYAKLAITQKGRADYLANSYQYLGSAYLKKGQIDNAFQNLQLSKALKESLFDDQHTQLATLYIDLGRAFEANLQVDSALFYYQKALSSARISQHNVSGVDMHIQAGDDLASMQEALNNIIDLLIRQYHKTNELKYLVSTHPYFQLFDRLMDLSRTNFSTEGSKLILSGNHKKTYEKAIETNYQLYKSTPSDSLLQAVFHFMEKSKSIVLLESIYQAEKYQHALSDSLYEQQQSLRSQLAYIQSELIYAEQNPEEKKDITYWQLQKANVLRKIEALNQDIETLYPNFYNASYQKLAINIDSLQKQMTEDQAAISYFWGDSAVYVLLITSTEVKVNQVTEMAKLRYAITSYLEVLTHDSVLEPSYTNYLQFQVSAYALHQLLLKPLLTDEEVKHLIIIPDGDLTNIPFESLITAPVETADQVINYKNLPYLIKNYEVSYEFSMSVAFWEPQFAKSFSDDHELKVAAFGIKVFDQLPGNLNYPPLGGAEREVKYILEKFPQANIFLNAEATEMQFKQLAPEVDILHIATHGMADLKNPFASKFIFYPGGEEDGTFNLYELYNIPLRTKVLMLSACESGVGKHYKGEGNFSLARSFVYAGSKSVVMSLWQVNDLITEQMIKGIYDQIVEGLTISEALRKTKITFIEEGLYAHPQCWAGMVPLGNTRIKFSQTHYIYYFMAGLIGFGIGAIFFVRIVFHTPGRTS